MRAFHPDLSGSRHSVHIPAALSSPCTANTCSPNLEGTERKYRALLNALRVGFAVFDRDGCIIVENTLRENIDEEILLIENLDLKNTKFYWYSSLKCNSCKWLAPEGESRNSFHFEKTSRFHRYCTARRKKYNSCQSSRKSSSSKLYVLMVANHYLS